MAGEVDDDAVTRDAELTQTTPHDSNDETLSVGRGRVRPPSGPIETIERYRVGKLIARGGMGEILDAHDLQIGREVAIKRMRATDPSQISLARFLREARIQGRLDHPAIVPVHELAYDDAGRPFFVMKKLSGTTLSDVLRANDRAGTSRQRLLRAFADVCLAIEFAHIRGVIHRDIKPSNILLGDYGEVYVLDWGLARLMDAADDPREAAEQVGDVPGTVVGTVLGTPGYMSPEQIRGEPDLDGRTDVYALGCILYEILANVPLHPRGEAGLHSALATTDARPSRHAVDGIPPELDTLCVRATHRERAARISSARELGEAVQRYLDGDRDLEQRARLASEHLASATAAFEAGDNEDQRRAAMREAGQALALAPTLVPAAELVGRLMLEPPRITPKAVVAELATIDDVQSRYHARIGVAVHAGYLVIALVFALIGMRDGYVAALVAISAVNVIAAWGNTRRRAPWLLAIVVLGNVVSIVLFARAFTPFLVAPGIAAVTVMAFAFHPVAARPTTLAFVAGGSIVGVIAMWALEAGGVLSRTMHVEGGNIFLYSPIDQMGRLPVEGSLCFYAATLLIAAAVISHSSAKAARVARDHLHVQAWQLRQLISVPFTSSRTSGAHSPS